MQSYALLIAPSSQPTFIRISSFDIVSMLNAVIAASSKNSVFYLGDSGVQHFNPINRNTCVAIDYTSINSAVTSLDARDNILVAGTQTGEFFRVNTTNCTLFKTQMTMNENGIQNHLHLMYNRSGSLLCHASSNDEYLRVVDIETGSIVSEMKYDWSINVLNL
jgi:hypothetical protein